MVTTHDRTADAAARELVDGRYVLLDRLGAGGMAEVWRARDERTGEIVALKRLHPHLRADAAALERFRREAEVGEMVRDPRVVTVRSSRVEGDEAYLVMDHVAGGSLADRLVRDRTLPVLAAVRFARDVAEGLAAAHAQGIVHRDVTASNILLDPDDGARLADFGIARPVDDLRAVTAVGDIVGTLRAMAPEVLAGEPPTPASDVWSLGAVLYEAVVGRAPFAGAAPAALLTARQARPAPVEGLPDALNDVLARMLQPDPLLRPADGREAARALAAVLTGISHERSTPDDVTREMPVVVAPAAAAVGVESPAAASDHGPRRRVGVGALVAVAAGILAVAVLAAGSLADAPAFTEPASPAVVAPVVTPEPAATAAPAADADGDDDESDGEAEDDEAEDDEPPTRGRDREKGSGKGNGDNGRGRGRGD